MIEDREEVRARTILETDKDMRMFKERLDQEWEFKFNQFKQ
jgi:hypothetical protein